jgi:hypothetical protein
MWYIAIAIAVAQAFALLLGAAAFRAAGRADRALEMARDERSAA